jgi:predicted nucleic acid-binding protein
MVFVVDASVAIKWFVEEALSQEAALLTGLGVPLYAPDLFLAEVANAAWKLAERHEISLEHAQVIVDATTLGVPTIVASKPYIAAATALALRLQHPVHDCLYLTCAERLGGRMVTADARLLAAVKGTEADPHVCHLRDVVPAL